MYNRKWEEPQPKEQIEVWECISEDCKGWMRKDYSFEDQPDCPLCGNQMHAGERLIVKIMPNLHKK